VVYQVREIPYNHTTQTGERYRFGTQE
jgi:hypothetical protein